MTEILVTVLFSDTTEDGVLCKIPFRGKKNDPYSKKFYKCTKYDSSGWWCATSTKEDYTYASWDWC